VAASTSAAPAEDARMKASLFFVFVALFAFECAPAAPARLDRTIFAAGRSTCGEN
jgi:hypothetical protein